MKHTDLLDHWTGKKYLLMQSVVKLSTLGTWNATLQLFKHIATLSENLILADSISHFCFKLVILEIILDTERVRMKDPGSFLPLSHYQHIVPQSASPPTSLIIALLFHNLFDLHDPANQDRTKSTLSINHYSMCRAPPPLSFCQVKCNVFPSVLLSLRTVMRLL